MTGSVSDIREALDNPVPAPALAQPGDAPEKANRERPPFPPGCPVKCLGIKSNQEGKQTCYYLDANGQLVGLEANNRHGKLGMIALFGAHSDWLEEHFPQWSKPIYEGKGPERRLIRDSEIVGFDQAEAARALVEECCRKGPFNAANKLRGTGAHRFDNKGLVLHCGDRLLVTHLNAQGEVKGLEWVEPGVVGSHVYPAGERIPRPWHEPVGPDAARLLVSKSIGPGGLPGLLTTWNWRRELVDPRLLLGAIGGSFVGGWLGWRPNVWITGGRGTGKSTLNGEGGVLPGLFGDGVFRTAQATAAAIRQSLRNSTLPVMFDELEAKADDRKVREVIELARLASSGDKGHRGGADHTATEFTLRSCFWFSSINIPPLEPQDRSRLAICELKPFAADAVKPDFAAYNLPLLGRKLMRRMIDALPRLDAIKHKYHEALAAAGHDGRACDQFGTLLACADALLHDWDNADGLPDDEEVAHWADLCRPERMREISHEEADHARCMGHLLTSHVQARGGDEREPLGNWVGDGVEFVTAPLLSADPAADRGQAKANARLQTYGLKLVHGVFYPEERDAEGKLAKAARWGAEGFEDAKRPGFLAVAVSHTALAGLMRDTPWQSWADVLRRFPGAVDCQKLAFGSLRRKAVLVPLHHVLDEDPLPEASREAGFAAWLAEQGEGAGE